MMDLEEVEDPVSNPREDLDTGDLEVIRLSVDREEEVEVVVGQEVGVGGVLRRTTSRIREDAGETLRSTTRVTRRTEIGGRHRGRRVRRVVRRRRRLLHLPRRPPRLPK